MSDIITERRPSHDSATGRKPKSFNPAGQLCQAPHDVEKQGVDTIMKYMKANGLITPLFVLVTGPACTGKTTLSRVLADRFHLPLFHKDGFKERMYDAVCPDGNYEDRISRDFSKLLGRFSMDCLELVLEQCARSNTNAVFEANFDSKLFSPRLFAIRERYPFFMVQVQMYCQGDVLLSRFVERETADRHPGHGGLRHLEALRHVLLRGRDEPLEMEEGDIFVEVDSTDLSAIDYEPLCDIIAQRLTTY